MRIEEGKRYVDRRGRVIGPMVLQPEAGGNLFGESAGDFGWYSTGKRTEGTDVPSDLVAEYVEPVSPSEVSGKESTVQHDLSGIPAGYEFVGYRLVQVGDQYLGNVGGDKVYVAAAGDVTLRKLRLIVKPIIPPEPKQRTVLIHKWLVSDKAGKECIRFGTAEWVNGCKFKNVVDLGLYEEVKVSV